MGISSVERASPALSALRIDSMPWYAKHLTSTSARILTGLGVRRRAMTDWRSERMEGSRFRGLKTESDSLGVSVWVGWVKNLCVTSSGLIERVWD